MPDRDASPGLSAEADSPFFVSPLTDRQCEVLGLAALGLSDGEIGQCLVISAFTVQSHLRNIRERLAARNTVHAVAIALWSGLIQFDPSSATGPM